jgi:hypothetical protein
LISTSLLAGAPQQPQSAAPDANPSPEADEDVRPERKPVRLDAKPISSDPSIKYDYDIVFVRSPRRGDNVQTSWPDVFLPIKVEPGADLMLLHPDGSEELLVKAGAKQAVTDPFVSFDAQWVFYALFDGIERRPSGQALATSSDLFKINLKTKQIVQLTHQEYTPNTGIVKEGHKKPVFNLNPCPLPGGQLMFTSDRNGLVPTKDYMGWAVYREDYVPRTMQLFRMDQNGSNVENVGHLNINTALHPVILRDGRVMFSSFENAGLRDTRAWAMWTIHPDGTHWLPLWSAVGASSEGVKHFATQLSDGHIIVEAYYFQNNMGFGSFMRMDESAAPGEPYFGPADSDSPRNWVTNLHPIAGRESFTPQGFIELTPWVNAGNSPAFNSVPRDPNSPRSGKLTHPAGAPDNNLLLVYSTGPTYGVALEGKHHESIPPAIHAGIYMIKAGQVTDEPAKMLMIKQEPDYNLQWPRAVVTYKRIYGIDEPPQLAAVPYDRHLAKDLPEGTPFGLIGSASLYKRETYPRGKIPAGKVTSEFAGVRAVTKKYLYDEDPFLNLGGLFSHNATPNWGGQGADAGKYSNDDIHAIRILATEPTTDPKSTAEGARRWWNAANERYRIMGEFPVRKFNGDKQPVDPDGNADTSFLAKIPADVAWTFQTLDKNGMVLNMAQTWHQVRPGEVRTDCGGCHAHSQKPTPWEQTAAAKASYKVFDLTKSTPLITTKKNDESHQKWDVKNETGVRYAKSAQTVEFFRDVKPIFERSCVGCHTQKWEKPAGHLVLDDDQPVGASGGFVAPGAYSRAREFPGTFARLAMDPIGKYSYASPVVGGGYGQASRYVRFFQSRRSLLAWKIFGQRLDGWSNDDFAYETVPGDHTSLQYKGKPIAVPQRKGLRTDGPAVNLAYTGSIMPPPEAVAGTYKAPNGKLIKVQPLSDEDRLTIVRWIDLGCPIDFANDAAEPYASRGWLADDSRPTLAVAFPAPDENGKLSRVVVGMDDYESGLDLSSFHVTADFNLDGAKAGTDLAARFKQTSAGVWEMKLAKPLSSLASGQLKVSVKDKQGNVSEIQRTFSVTLAGARNKHNAMPAKSAKSGPAGGHVSKASVLGPVAASGPIN